MPEASVLEDRLNSALMRFVDSKGNVAYLSLEEDGTVDNYVNWLETFNPNDLKTRNEKLAFWINAYNMLTIYGVCKQLMKNPNFAKKGHKSLFQRIRFFWWKKYKIGGRKYSLYQIENKILRKEFAEPRIHFALNCASQSCPILKNGLYSAETLEQELEMATTLFIRSPKGAGLDRKNKILYLSSIFKWYRKDFKKTARSVVDFVKKYLSEDDHQFLEDNRSELKISYQEYDWNLNMES